MISVDVDAVFAWIIVSVLGMVLTAVVVMFRRMSSQVDEVHKAHLGPKAMDRDGNPRWYRHDNDQAMERFAKIVEDNTAVMRALLEEIRIDREVNQRILERDNAKKE